MLFNSLQFLIFLPLVTLLYYVLPVRYRIWLLLAASFYFYMAWKAVYILLVILSTLVDYYCGLKMSQFSEKRKRKPYMYLSLVSNLTILGTFKYYNFFSTSVNELFNMLNMHYMLPLADLILPIGISFYTFQTMSYAIDIYKGKYTAEKNLAKFSLYVTFFPQLVAGPIERAKHLLSQFHFDYRFDTNNITSGLRLIMFGMFKKVVIADQLGPLVGNVFNNPEGSYGLSIYLGSLLFAQQIYCDFSGYSDIARGSARLLGIDLMENFRLPFYAKNFQAFWAQWHISLMNWFRDYIMFPLIKKRWSWQTVFFVVFLLSGFWHGAKWTFVIWGIYNAIIVIYSKATLKYRTAFLDRIGLKRFTGFRNFIQAVCVIHLFSMASVFFRADSLSDSWVLINNLFNNFSPGLDALASNADNIRKQVLFLGTEAINFKLLIGLMFILELTQWNLRKQDLDTLFNKIPVPFRLFIYAVASVIIILMLNVAEKPFIYFQF